MDKKNYKNKKSNDNGHGLNHVYIENVCIQQGIIMFRTQYYIDLSFVTNIFFLKNKGLKF